MSTIVEYFNTKGDKKTIKFEISVSVGAVRKVLGPGYLKKKGENEKLLDDDKQLSPGNYEFINPNFAGNY